MKENNHILTLEETEELCRLYWACKLSPFEEMELQYVLLNSQFDSSLINETKDFMGAESLISRKSSHFSPRKPLYKKHSFYRIAAAAVIVMLLSFFLQFITIPQKAVSDNNVMSNYECIVFSNGEQLSGEEAMTIARANIEQIEEFEKIINKNINEQNKKIENIIHTLNSKQ